MNRNYTYSHRWSKIIHVHHHVMFLHSNIEWWLVSLPEHKPTPGSSKPQGRAALTYGSRSSSCVCLLWGFSFIPLHDWSRIQKTAPPTWTRWPRSGWSTTRRLPKKEPSITGKQQQQPSDQKPQPACNYSTASRTTTYKFGEAGAPPSSHRLRGSWMNTLSRPTWLREHPSSNSFSHSCSPTHQPWRGKISTVPSEMKTTADPWETIAHRNSKQSWTTSP